MVTAADYASLIDPTRPCLSRGRRKAYRGWNPRTLPQARDAGLASAEAWEFGQIPSLPPLAVATTMRR